MKDHSRTRITVLALLLFALVGSACVTREQVGEEGDGGGGGATQRLSIATGGTGGVYLVYGGGLSDLITRQMDGFEATAEVTSASVDNMLLIGEQSSDLAFTLADTAADAVRGDEAFDEEVPAQALAQLYTNYTQVATTGGTGIETVADLEGKAVSVGSPNSGTEVIALRILDAAGIDPDSGIDRQQLDVEQSVQALRDGTIDAFFWSGGLPTGAITDLGSTDAVVLLPTDEYTQDLADEYGGFYTTTTIPGGTYPGLDEDVETIGVPNYLVVHEAIEDDLAYELTKLLFDHRDDLINVHPEARNLNLETATDVEPLDLHPGAQRYYDEASGQ